MFKSQNTKLKSLQGTTLKTIVTPHQESVCCLQSSKQYSKTSYFHDVLKINFCTSSLAERKIKKGDDFIGRLFYPLRAIPMSSGVEKTFTLVSHQGRSQCGTITLQLNVKILKESFPEQVGLIVYSKPSLFSSIYRNLSKHLASKAY